MMKVWMVRYLDNGRRSSEVFLYTNEDAAKKKEKELNRNMWYDAYSMEVEVKETFSETDEPV